MPKRTQLLNDLNDVSRQDVLNVYIREAQKLPSTGPQAYEFQPVWRCVALLDEWLTSDELARLSAFVHAYNLGVLSALTDGQGATQLVQCLLGRLGERDPKVLPSFGPGCFFEQMATLASSRAATADAAGASDAWLKYEDDARAAAAAADAS